MSLDRIVRVAELPKRLEGIAKRCGKMVAVRPVVCAVVVAITPVGALAAPGGPPTAPVLARSFHMGSTRVALPKRCKRKAVRSRLIATLGAFNTGRGDAFALNFAPRMAFVPYDGTALAPRGGMSRRASAAEFVRRRYSAGDGWTALALIPPSGGSELPAAAVYTVSLQVLIAARTLAPRPAKVVVNCATGLIRNWVGPRVPA